MVLPPLYAILDTDVVTARGLSPLDVCDAWLDAGVRLVQLRAKSMASGPMLELADVLVTRTRAAGARLIVNDRADIARLSGADGVHVGQDDLSPAAVRNVMGPASIVGWSTHNDEQVALGVRAPVSYLAVGPVFETRTKAAGAAVGINQVARASAMTRAADLPLVAIGGLTLAQAPLVRAAGADVLAVIGDLLGTEKGRGLVERARAWIAASA